MRIFAFIFMLMATGCTHGQFIPGLESAGAGSASIETRGKGEVFVKTNHPALIADIQRGGGATLIRVYDIANAPQGLRALKTLRLQSNLPLYSSNLDALTLAIMAVSR